MLLRLVCKAFHKLFFSTQIEEALTKFYLCPVLSGTLLLEFGILSRLTGVSTFESAAKRAVDVIWEKRSKLDLLGITLNVETGKWKQTHSSIGAGVDSFYEYLLKTFVLFGDAKYLKMFEKAYDAVNTYIIDGTKYREVSMSNGNKYQSITSSLAAFWPALQVLKGDIDGGKETFKGFYELWSKFNAIPDLYNLDSGKLLQYGRDWPLRPEVVESAYHLYTATRDIKYIKVAQHVVRTLQNTSRVKCGYASIADVRTHRLDDRMDSYFLSETTKYLYLIFHEAYLHPPVAILKKASSRHNNEMQCRNERKTDKDHANEAVEGEEDTMDGIGGVPWQCVAWRQTGNCDGSGAREPQFDDFDCSTRISTYKSGYCECVGTNMFNLHSKIERHNCGHKEFSCADECKKYFSNYINGNQYSDKNDFDIGLSDTNEPLPIDMNQIVFSTEGHVFLLWSSLRPSRLPKYESRTARSENYKDVTLSSCPSQDSIYSHSSNAGRESIVDDVVQTSTSSTASGEGRKGAQDSNPSSTTEQERKKSLPKVINIMPETGMKYLATALGQHIASGGSLSLSGNKQLQLECDYRGMCTIGGDTLTGSFALGQILLSTQGGVDNQREDVLSMEGSTAQFGPSVNSTHVLGEPIIAEPLDACSPLAGPIYKNSITLVERGDCSFVEKARNVQNAGGAAMIVMDKGGTTYIDDKGEEVGVERIQENESFQMADDGTGSDIFIPSLLVSEKDGNNIMLELAKDLSTDEENSASRFFVMDIWSDDERVNAQATTGDANRKGIHTKKPQVFPLTALLNVGLLPANLVDSIKSAFHSSTAEGSNGRVAVSATSVDNVKTSP